MSVVHDGFATIRTRGRKLNRSISTEGIVNSNKIGRKYDSDILYGKHSDETKMVLRKTFIEDFTENDIDDIYKSPQDVVNSNFGKSCEINGIKRNESNENVNHRDPELKTMETFKPKNIQIGNSSMDLKQSMDCLSAFSYDLMLPPLKSPQYINQLNAMRLKPSPIHQSNHQQLSLYSRPDSPKYGKIIYNNRSTSPSMESLDNCSSHSSGYSNRPSLLQSIEDEKLIIVNRKPPIKTKSLQYRKSFSHVQRTDYYNGNGNVNGANSSFSNTSTESVNYENISTRTIPKIITKSSGFSNNEFRKFSTLNHPKDKLLGSNCTKSTSSLNEIYFDQNNWDLMDCKIGCQTTLRSKPRIPWYELAIKKENRQSLPLPEVIISMYFFIL